MDDEPTFEKMMDNIDANIKRIRREIAREIEISRSRLDVPVQQTL